MVEEVAFVDANHPGMYLPHLTQVQLICLLEAITQEVDDRLTAKEGANGTSS